MSKTTSPKGGNRGCLCKDGSYSSKCCDEQLQSQGVGSLVEQGSSSVNNINSQRVITNSSN